MILSNEMITQKLISSLLNTIYPANDGTIDVYYNGERYYLWAVKRKYIFSENQYYLSKNINWPRKIDHKLLSLENLYLVDDWRDKQIDDIIN